MTEGPYADHVYAVTADMGNHKLCRFCGVRIISGITNKGKASWFDAMADSTNRHPNHWVTCANADQARAAYKRLDRRRTGR